MPTFRSRRIGVVVAEDDPGMRGALAALIGSQPDLELLGVASGTEEAITLAADRRPHVCIVDVRMPGGGGPRAARDIRATSPATQILALSGHEDRATVLDMLRAGAAGYLVKGNDGDEVIEAIRAAASGRRTLSRQVADGVVGALADKLAREDDEAAEDAARRARIAGVLDRGLPAMALQPIVDLRTRAVVGHEALARFAAEPVRPPDVWFAEAAQAGRLQELELAAVRAALADLPRLPAGTYLTVNLSPSTAGSDALLALLPPSVGERVVVEITEHAPIDDYDAFVPRLDRLRRRGVRVAIDDTGAGFASLRHILRLAPDVIKTDLTLTRRIASDRAERALIRALISFAAETGATLVAEGIESEADLRALTEIGVRFGQGFHLGRPGRPDVTLGPATSPQAATATR